MKNTEIYKTEKIIDEYIMKICQFDKLNKTLEEKLSNIDFLTDNLIDYCIKKKIFYFIENKINYKNIVNNFKTHLIKFIRNLVDPNNNIIKKYIVNVEELDNVSMSKFEWDNISDINSVMFKNFKNLNESFDKNVSFKEKNTDMNKEIETDKIFYNEENINLKFFSLYVKLLINQNKYLVEFTFELIKMCDILSELDIKYKKHNPYN